MKPGGSSDFQAAVDEQRGPNKNALLRRLRTAHQRDDGLLGTHSLVDDFVDLFDDRHLDIQFGSNVTYRAGCLVTLYGLTDGFTRLLDLVAFG